jgi:hypothetical protein
MPTIDQRELGICAEQQSEEWEVLGVRSTSQLHTISYLQSCSLSTLTMSPETYQVVS